VRERESEIVRERESERVCEAAQMLSATMRPCALVWLWVGVLGFRGYGLGKNLTLRV